MSILHWRRRRGSYGLCLSTYYVYVPTSRTTRDPTSRSGPGSRRNSRIRTESHRRLDTTTVVTGGIPVGGCSVQILLEGHFVVLRAFAHITTQGPGSFHPSHQRVLFIAAGLIPASPSFGSIPASGPSLREMAAAMRERRDLTGCLSSFA